MDFDEYDYLEKAVEPAEALKASNGSTIKSRSAEKRRSGEEGDDGEDGYSRSKRHRSGDGDKDRSERYERERSHREKSRDRDRNRERERAGDRSERAHRDRGERTYREPEKDYRDGDRKNRSKDIDRDRDNDRDRAKDQKEVERSVLKEQFHSRNRGYERYDTERPRDVDRDYRYSREKREKKEDGAAEPEADPERDQRTVFAFQISLKADERDVYDFFSRAGKVRDVRLIMDRNTRRSKGVGYIEFYDAMSVPMAIALTGQPLLGQPVMVKPSEAEKNLVPSASSTSAGVGGPMGQFSGSARRLYVGNLHFNIGEEQLRQVFEPFGTIELVQLPLDSDTGLSKGYGFVQYARFEDARSAQTALNGNLELAGRFIKVALMTDQNSGPDSVVVPGELDDDDGGGLSLTARSRALLMQKLDRSGTVASVQNVASSAGQAPPSFNVLTGASMPAVPPIVPGLGIPGMVGLQNAGLSALGGAVAEPIGVPTECLLLKNMFDPSTETEPDFDADIKEEVMQECGKYGAVKHVHVDKDSAGHVYLKFNNLTSSMNAQRALHGRWFAGKMITTTYMAPQVYEAKFPDSRG